MDQESYQLSATLTRLLPQAPRNQIGHTEDVQRLLGVLTLASLTLFAANCAQSSPRIPGQARGAWPRAVAFDNVYGRTPAMKVYVTVDTGAEMTLFATCDQKTCTVGVPLTNGPHTLLLAVEQDGKRSEPTKITLDTAAVDAKR